MRRNERLLSVTLDVAGLDANPRGVTERMVASFRAGAPTHDALVRMDAAAVGRLMASVLVGAGTLQADVLASVLYDPRRDDGYMRGRSPGPAVVMPMAEGTKVITEGWWWLVREGHLAPDASRGRWVVTRKGEAWTPHRTGRPARRAGILGRLGLASSAR